MVSVERFKNGKVLVLLVGERDDQNDVLGSMLWLLFSTKFGKNIFFLKKSKLWSNVFEIVSVLSQKTPSFAIFSGEVIENL
jgi:hypothetical protein